MSGNKEVVSVPLLDVVRDNESLNEEFIAAAARVIKSGQYIGGPDVQALEHSLAEFCETRFAIGCASGSDALLLALMSIDLKPGDEVLLPSFTFFATASCVTRLGGVPVFIDIDPVTFNINAGLMESQITSRTRAIIPVHLFGQCADMTEIMDIAERNSLRVIEDCAQSIGATWCGRQSGSIGDIGCFSFYPTKNFGGFGDGGVMTTNDPDLADRIRLLANHGMRPRYYHQAVGLNSRLDSIQAALLNVKLPKLAEWTAARQANATWYQKAFSNAGLDGFLRAPVAEPECGHVWNQFTIRIPGGQRDAVRQKLNEAKIGAEIYYPIPLHKQTCFAEFNSDRSPLVETERASNEVLSLPIFPGLKTAEKTYVVDQLQKILCGKDSAQRRAA